VVRQRVRQPLFSHLPWAFRWWILRLAERYSERQEAEANASLQIHESNESADRFTCNLWAYVATIGELNLADRFLRRLSDAMPGSRLILLTDRALYVEAYRRKFPQAVVAVTDGRTPHTRELLRKFPPTQLVIVEIPCWPADAPCRLRYPLPALVARQGTPVALVNAWTYGYSPASRLEALESALFNLDFLRTPRLITAQTEEVREKLLAEGARPERVFVTGNMKFDGLAELAAKNAAPRADSAIESLSSGGRPCIVAGCIAEFDEQEAVVCAYATVRESIPPARLIIAPRHPENAERMTHLARLLDAHRLTWTRRSEHGTAPLPAECDCLVIDTFGELVRFYAAAEVAFVGRDHNVLEPLAFDVPVTVLSGWEPTFPSFPVYSILSQRGALHESRDHAGLAANWLRFLRSPAPVSEKAWLADLAGATDRNLTAVLGLVSLTARRGERAAQ